MEIFDDKSMSFLERYLKNPSPSGFEREGQKIWLDYINPYIDEHIVDSYGSVIGVINPKADYKVVIEAHSDEIGWVVKFISKDGMISVEKLGASDVQCAPGKRVDILTRDGVVNGVFGHTAVHMRSKEHKPMINNLFIDVGCLKASSVEELGICIGDPIVFSEGFSILNDTKFVGRGLDNRIGGFMIAQVARLLKENNNDLDFGLYIVNAVQEEVGKNGAKMVCGNIKPDLAIVTDVTHDTSTPGVPSAKGDYKITRGPVIPTAPPIQRGLHDHVIAVAEEEEIKFQRKVMPRTTGTDADVFAYENGGRPTVLISLPMRYMHTPVETVSKYDVEKIVKLMYKTILSLNPDINFNKL
jgi:putative aminopeptidase FrvX